MNSKCTTSILKKLREIMKNTSYVSQSLQAYIIPSCDAHQSEYIAACDKRREYVSGFSGSAGTAVVTQDYAALWTDGRYYLQAKQQLDSNWTLMKDGMPDTPSEGEWLSTVLPVGSAVGFDSFLLTYDSWKTLRQKLKIGGHTLVPVKDNLVDYIWEERPSPPLNSVEYLPIEYTGKTFQDKIAEIRQEMTKNNASVLIVTALDEVAWIFNLRGSDIEYNPVFFAYAIITLTTVHLFVDEKKLTPVATREIQHDSLNVQIHPYEALFETIGFLLAENLEGSVWVNGLSSYGVVSLIPEERLLLKCSPVAVKKAIKNQQEIEGARNAHIKDAVALCEFFYWLSHQVPDGNITEITAAEKLDELRKSQTDFVGPSFSTISASGPNGAIIHYCPAPETNRNLSTEELYLCDSGGQYRDGTTDVTRTWHFGAPSSFEMECYTLVLKGHIALQSAVFPTLIKGESLDAFARKSLWESGLDYLHGTGHGVGAYLNVHEGPIGISFRHRADDPGLQPGMILSIEPGYYENEQFGIRLENLSVVKKKDTPYNFQNKGFLTFESLTLFPFQTKLINPSMLTSSEIKWLNEYHTACRDVVGKALEEQGKSEVLQWLLKETLPLG
ncbi:xaa-Pro aminopeptidase 1-like [Uloborus diversus]|uniref:xaa-Pro aminopeptidase 1-like n=1 Tax=Uloborus diversus TaxID=327109 RepID=UPI002409D4AA|nr:xaa-Pro aminopeptidase 1-like [Uloborus diversus]